MPREQRELKFTLALFQLALKICLPCVIRASGFGLLLAPPAVQIHHSFMHSFHFSSIQFSSCIYHPSVAQHIQSARVLLPNAPMDHSLP